MQKLFNDQHKLLIERNKLQTIKNRIEKLNKINELGRGSDLFYI